MPTRETKATPLCMLLLKKVGNGSIINNIYLKAIHFYIGHENVAHVLLSNGWNVNAKNDKGMMPLHYAVAGGN